MKIPSHLSCNFPQLHNAQFSCVARPRCPLVLSDAVILLSLEPGLAELELHGSRITMTNARVTKHFGGL